MKDYLAAVVRESPTPIHGRNVVREYMQARILASMQRHGAFLCLAFYGGTALRFLYALPRFSEDLDFTLTFPDADYDFRKYLREARTELTAEGYPISIKVSDQRSVHSAFIGFPGLLYELGLSAHESEAVSIKLEVDTRPPTGVGLDTTVIRRYALLQLHHHDPASLLAGKLHAILNRTFTKGRDLYDLFWYLSSPGWPGPNLALLNNGLHQTGWQGPELTAHSWPQVIRERLDAYEWRQVIEDVNPFVESSAELAVLTQANLIRLLER